MDLFDLLPEAEEDLRRRYLLIREIDRLEHAGRRVLSASLRIPERTVRNDIASLLSTQVLCRAKGGVSLTDKGRGLLQELPLKHQVIFRRIRLEEELSDITGAEVRLVRHGFPVEDRSFLCIQPVSVETTGFSERELNVWKNRGAEAVAGGLIFSKEGKPLLRLRRQEQIFGPPAVLFGDASVSPEGHLAAVRYLKPERLILTEKAAENLWQSMLRRGRNICPE